MRHTYRRNHGNRVPLCTHPGVRGAPEPPDGLPECHPCHGCPAADLSSCKPFCFLPSCLREELGKPFRARRNYDA
jgi:hypothetical protein